MKPMPENLGRFPCQRQPCLEMINFKTGERSCNVCDRHLKALPRPIDVSRRYLGTVKLRRGPGWPVKPECEGLEGTRAVFIPAWRISAEDHSLYAGEWAMLTPDGWPTVWLASGDLTDIKDLTE